MRIRISIPRKREVLFEKKILQSSMHFRYYLPMEYMYSVFESCEIKIKYRSFIRRLHQYVCRNFFVSTKIDARGIRSIEILKDGLPVMEIDIKNKTIFINDYSILKNISDMAPNPQRGDLNDIILKYLAENIVIFSVDYLLKMLVTGKGKLNNISNFRMISKVNRIYE